MPEPETEYRVVISKRAAQQMVEHAAFLAKLGEQHAYKLIEEFRSTAASLQKFPYRNPILRSPVFSTEKYRKVVFSKWYLMIYQIKGDTVYVEYVMDGRQDYQWLLPVQNETE